MLLIQFCFVLGKMWVEEEGKIMETFLKFLWCQWASVAKQPVN